MTSIQDIKNASIFLNMISQTHAESIPRFAFIALENVESVEVDYDLDHSLAVTAPSTHAGFFVKYRIKTKGKKSVGNKQRPTKLRLKDIEAWVRSITWNEVNVKFVINGKEAKL